MKGLCLAARALGAVCAAAPAAPKPETLLYSATWAGLPAADIAMRLEEGEGGYRSEIEIRTKGLPRLFTRFRGLGRSSGAISAAGFAEPLEYDAFYDLRSRKGKRISLRFLREGGRVIAERGPEDGSSSSNPPLPAAQRVGVVDPLTTVDLMREALRTGAARGRGFHIPVYDGKRRFEVEERGLTRERRRFGGKEEPVLHLALQLRPIAGFRPDGEEGSPDAAPRPLDVFFSDDAALVPLRLEVAIAYFTVVVELTGRCEGAVAACGVAAR